MEEINILDENLFTRVEKLMELSLQNTIINSLDQTIKPGQGELLNILNFYFQEKEFQQNAALTCQECIEKASKFSIK
jgi:hypothetical protein